MSNIDELKDTQDYITIDNDHDHDHWHSAYSEYTWYRRSIYPKRSMAIQAWCDELSCHYIDARARLTWLRPATIQESLDSDGWYEVFECEKEHPMAFQCWEIR